MISTGPFTKATYSLADREVFTGLGLKVTGMFSVAFSFGGVVSLFTFSLPFVEVLMKNSISKLIGVWCGVALLWRPGGSLPPCEMGRGEL